MTHMSGDGLTTRGTCDSEIEVLFELYDGELTQLSGLAIKGYI